LLASPGIVERATAGSMLLPTGALPEPAALLALRARGALIGVPDGPPEHSPAADFVVLQAAAGGIDTLLLSAQRWHEARPRLPVVALGLESIADVERALSSGVMLAGGRLDTAGPQPPARPLHAAAHRICALLNDLAMDRETAVVAEAVRGDVALSYRLLRYANSPAIGLRQGADSVDFAVALLGRAELVRWLGVMLLSAAGGRQLSAALQEHALARGRLLEALAQRAGLPRPEALFTLGLLSRLDTLVQMPLAAALEPLRLSEEARQALLRREGPWAPFLAVADELERDDEARFAKLSAPFGGIDAVLAEAELAWGWAAEVAGTQQAD
jgi:EAL and modified HD-GYP domain-containing signal transduction protein